MNHWSKTTLLLFAGLALVLTGCSNKGYGQATKFSYPDIKDDFCGVQINFQYCKCAFHNEFCDAIGLKKGAANDYVQSEFDKWLSLQLASFGDNCVAQGGIFKKDKCQYCDEGYLAKDGNCVSAADESQATEEEFVPDGPLTADCKIKPDEFDQDWKKYSDIDEVIPFEERSYEAKQTLTTYETMVAKMVEAFSLERDIEIENQMQAELQEYKAALVQNIKTNLLKAFWRLSWVTYTTVQSGKGLGESYSQLLTTGAAAETIGAGLKVVQGIIPGDSSLAIDTSEVSGKVKSVGVNVALEAVDSLGDPVKIATELIKSAANAPLPSADITQEEIDILKTQHINNGVIDKIIAESQADNNKRQAKLATLEQEINQLQTEVNSWENQEKERVKVSLETSCQQLKNRSID